MASKKTSLITGSNAKIRVGGVTMAYAVDLQYDLSVATIPVETMGRYEVLANEPISTTISGSFTVVRYTAAAAKTASGTVGAQSGGLASASSVINGAAAGGNGIGKWKAASATQAVSAHVNPGDILTATTVDIEVFQKTMNDPSGDTETGGVYLVKKIKDARITRMAGSVNKRGILMETFQFVAEMMDDDSFTSAHSGEADCT